MESEENERERDLYMEELNGYGKLNYESIGRGKVNIEN